MRPHSARRRRPEIVAKGGQPVDAQAEVDAGGAEINPLDQELNNAGLLRWEKLRPERFEFNQGVQKERDRCTASRVGTAWKCGSTRADVAPASLIALTQSTQML
jgi:hypothetical protein